MFEHLGPVPETVSKKKLFSRRYMVFLLIALIIYTVVDSSTSGPQVSAVYQEDEVKAVVFAAEEHDTNLVKNSHGIIFDFFISAAEPGTMLRTLKIKINGQYDPNILSGLKLYQGPTQVGEDFQVEGDYLVFDLGYYELSNPRNYFYILLNEGSKAKVGDNFYLSIEDRNDLFLSMDGFDFTADGNYPIVSQKVSVVERGKILFANNLAKENFYYLENQNIELANFSLHRESERASMYKIELSYDVDSEPFLEDAIFNLSANGTLITQGEVNAEENKVVFDFAKFVPLNNDKKQIFSIGVDSLPSGVYDFAMDAFALGYFSGKDIGPKNIVLNKIIVRENYPIFKQVVLSEDLKDGWNKLYSIGLRAAGNDSVALNKLTWKLNTSNLDVKDIRVFVDGKAQEVGLNFNKDTLSIVWLPELLLDKNELVLDLSVNVKNISQSSNINAYLMADSVGSQNILWSYNGQEYNAYLLPELPLAPQFLK